MTWLCIAIHETSQAANYILNHASTVYSHTKTSATQTLTHSHTSTQNGCSPLFQASEEGYDEIVEMLLQAGATVDLQTKVEDCYYDPTLFICHL